TVQTGSLLAKQDRLTHRHSNYRGGDRLDGEGEDEGRTGERQVERTFQSIAHERTSNSVSITRSTWSSVRAGPLGSVTPRRKRSCATPVVKVRLPAKTGCRCMGFHR